MSITLDHDNLSEYTNPHLYDAENRWGPDDDFYLALAKRVGGPVLDLACGTGRLTRALAQAGLTVTGVDLSAPMLARARELAGDLPITWHQGDCRDLSLGQRFRLALMTSHAFQHMLTNADQDRLLATVYTHLAAGGIFAFESRHPYSAEWEDSDWVRWRSYRLPADAVAATTSEQHVEVWMAATYDQPNSLEHWHFRRIVKSGDQAAEPLQSQITLRYTEVEPLNQRLVAHGFTVLEQYGNWMRHLVDGDSPEIITVCQRKI